MNKIKNFASKRHKITTIYGYSLFTLIVAGFVLTTMVPMVAALQYSGARHFNILILIIVFAISMILPALVAYFIGDATTRSKKETLHHYNGVLFGFASYWVVSLLGWIGFGTVFGVSDQPFPAPLVATNVIPVVLTLVLMTILAIAYARKQNKDASVLQFLPFQIVLIIGVAGTFLAPYVGYRPSVMLDSLFNLLFTITIPIIAYIALRKEKASKLAIVSDSLIAFSIAWIATWSLQSFISLTRIPYELSSIVSSAFGLLVFVVYLYLRLRK